MRLIFFLTLFATFLAPSIPHTSALAVGVDTTSLLDESREVAYPIIAAGYRVRRRVDVETNAQRMRRGLPPAPPLKLYGARREELNKRIANPPAQAVPSASARRYEFIGCYQTATGGTGDMRYEFTVTSNQELADKCAKQQDELANTAGAIQGFFINDFLPQNCRRSVAPSGTAVTCADASAGGTPHGAFYRLI